MPKLVPKSERQTTTVRLSKELVTMVRAVSRFADETGPEVLDRLIRTPLVSEFDALPESFRKRVLNKTRVSK